ncbi:MAG: hypothetical protein GY847_13040 [Proteobacteria bacterium]|nr:hypothetical protein [Pseudomonadota bacterium]
MQKCAIVIEFADIKELEKEFENNLRHGGTFARGASGFEQDQDCEVVLVHPVDGSKLSLSARVVLVVSQGSDQGVGIALNGFDGSIREKLSVFLNKPKTPERKSGASKPGVHERLRGLSVVDQHKVARGQNINDRIVLERIYGKQVWEPLLRNPRVSIPEVVRIARMGSLPRPLLELIVSNATWINASPIRRALLANPRMTGEMVNKVLRGIPRNELRIVAKQTAYSSAIRNAARKFLGNS